MATNNRLLVLVNTVTLVVMLFANYASNAGIFSSVNVADISHRYDTLFAPAGYAFIIWGFLFVGCIAFVVNQWILLKKNDPANHINRTGIWFALSNVANTLWIFCWINNMIGWSVILILILLVSLCILTYRLRLELDDEPVKSIFFVWWPIVFYLGWIMVATIACIAAWCIYNGWHGGGMGEDVWTIIMILVACSLYLLLIKKRNLREAAGVGSWAFIAIAVRQSHLHANIAAIAGAAAILLLIAAGIHGYKNRHYGVGAKIKSGEWG